MSKSPSSSNRSRKRRFPEVVDPETLRGRIIDLAHPRNADRQLAELVHELLDEFGRGLVPALVRLAVSDPTDQVHGGAVTLLFLLGNLPGRLLEPAREELVRALRDRAVPDDRKLELGPLLALAGHELPVAEYHACFEDFEGARRRMTRDGARSLADTVEALEAPLETTGLLGALEPAEPDEEDADKGFSLAAELAEHNPPVGASLLCIAAAIAAEHGLAAEGCERALELAAGTRTPRAAWFLEELGRWPATGQLGETARELARELSGVGIVAAPPTAGAFSHGLVSGIDGLGSRTVTLFFHDGEGSLHALELLLRSEDPGCEDAGLADVWCVFREGADVEGQLHEADVALAPCDLAFARELVADALATHERRGTPVPGRFLLARPFLGADPIEPRARSPRLGAYMLETFVRAPSMVDGSELVAPYAAYEDLWCASDAAYTFVAEWRRARRRGTKGGRRDRKPRLSEATIDEFARTVFARERETLARGLAAGLEIEARGGRARRAVNRLAVQAYLALVEEVVPFEQVPLVRALARRSIEAIDRNLALGFKSQREANEAQGGSGLAELLLGERTQGAR